MFLNSQKFFQLLTWHWEMGTSFFQVDPWSRNHHHLYTLCTFYELKCVEELQVAQITMGILFNISYRDMKSHITKLHGIIAHELNV